MEYDNIKEIVKNTLSEERYYHSICVAKKCKELAKIYNIDEREAILVGIAHDIAKEMSDEEKIKYAKKNNIEIDNVEEKHLGLLHAKIGADICKKRFGFTDKMCTAVLAHTTGLPDMNMLDKILYVSDTCGEDRNFDDIEYVRNLAKEDIDKAMIYLLELEIKNRIEKR